SACGSSMSPCLSTRDYNRRVADTQFRYSRCTHCGLISLTNVPDDLSSFYAGEYHVLPRNGAEIERGVQHERYKIELLGRYASRGRLLEIGPSWGAFCLLAKRAGFDVEAIEMELRCVNFLQTTIGVRAIHCGSEVDAIGCAAAPDVIAMWHVIEHLRDPWSLL